ncbi:hypothetical protein V1515DRAFT_615341 [Lipomyces mesembrius]
MSTDTYDEQDQLRPELILGHPGHRSRSSYLNILKSTLLTRDGWLGDYDYAYLFTPKIRFLRRDRKPGPFFGLNDRIPIVLTFILGFGHSLAMLANRDSSTSSLLPFCAAAFCPAIKSLYSTSPCYLGTGLISVVGTSFATIPVAPGAFAQRYSNGYCPVKLPCPDGYGAIIRTTCICALLDILLSILQKVFPPMVTGPTVLLIGIHLVQTSFEKLGGRCLPLHVPSRQRPLPALPRPSTPHTRSAGAPHSLSLSKWGPRRHAILTAVCGYFDRSTADVAPAVAFVWVHTFSVCTVRSYCACWPPSVTSRPPATFQRLEVEGSVYESCIQGGGVLAAARTIFLAGLMRMTPMLTFAQNNGFCCVFLIIMGIFSKFAVALVAIPSLVIVVMAPFLFCSVAVSGLRIVSTVPLTRRKRFIRTAALSISFGAILVPNWFPLTGLVTLFLNLFISDEAPESGEEAEALEIDAKRTTVDEELDEKTM